MRIFIPFRDAGDRRPLLDLVLREMGEATVVDSTGPEFSLAQARNAAVAMVDDPDEPIAVLDADTMVTWAGLRAAELELLADPLAGVQTPYTEYRAISYADTARAAQFTIGRPYTDDVDTMAGLDHVRVGVAVSGCYVTTPRVWWLLGGQDERMVGWGPEDYAMLAAHRAVFGRPFRRHPGTAYALAHERKDYDVTTDPRYRQNVQYYGEWQNAEAGGVRAVMKLAHGR